MSALLNPQDLAQQFADQVWTEKFGNVSSPALIAAWAQLFTTYNDCIGKNQRGERPVRKQVIPLPTGAGKSQATIFYLQQLEDVEDVGVLVVSYFEEEAKSACITINREAYGTADYHSSKHPLSEERINNTKVLYIAHAQYLLALQEPGRMKRLSNLKDKPRQLIIIDEQISQVSDYEFTLLNTTTLLSKIQTLLESDLGITDQERQGLEDEKAFLKSVRDLIKQSDVTTSFGVMLSADQHPLLCSDTGKLAYLSKFAKGGKKSVLAQVMRVSILKLYAT